MNEVGFDSLSVPKAYKTLNRLNQAFVDLIRSTGGKNPTLHLLIATFLWDNENGQFDRGTDTWRSEQMHSALQRAVSGEDYTPEKAQ